MSDHDENGKFKPGNCANPDGNTTPGGVRELAALKREARRVGAKDGGARRTALVEMLWEKAINGNLTAVRILVPLIGPDVLDEIRSFRKDLNAAKKDGKQ